ncbi:MAG: hypothetical protein JEZ04_14990 [Spirochaetales bacterium]|nr:hypothetical protein [Spirochaetales bacterium]
MIKKRLLITAAVTAVILFTLTGCEIFNPPLVSGQIEFVDYKEQQKIIAGNEGTMAFGEKLVGLGDRDVLPLAIKNTGEGPLVITNMYVKTIKSEPDEADIFSIIDGTFPDLPLSIPSGKTVNDIFLEFAPVTAGEFSGKVFIDTETDTYNLDLSGTGLWRLTLIGDPDGTITLPIEVDNGESLDITSSTGIFYLACETGFLREFNSWEVVSPVVADPLDPPANVMVFDNIKAKKTELVIKAHTSLTVDILNPYVLVPNDAADIQTAINNCAADNTKIAVVVRAGTYNVTGDITMKTGLVGAASNIGIPVYGGYNAAWSVRSYKTPANRLDAAYQTVINITGSVNASGAALNNKVVLEGFTLTKQAGGNDNALVVFNNSTTAGLLYNTITAGGTNASIGVHCTNSAAPLIRYNYINAGTTSADYSETYGIKITEGATPVIYKNSISGGSAGGTGSKSFGIFSDFECEPIVRNNAPTATDSYGIYGGSASGSGGESYGIYIINNGKIIASYNDINGGAGGSATALFANYGGYFKLYSNNIHTGGGTSRKGVRIGMSGRVYAFTGNGIYDCPDALLEEYFGGAMTDIDDVNDKFHVDTNTDAAVDLSAAPSEVMYE